jgi:hypothetical protein
MKAPHRIVTLALILLLAAPSLLMVQSAACTQIPQPSVPSFTVQLVDCSYDIPAIASSDPYTGEIVFQPGYRVENITLQIQVKNEPFTAFYTEEGTNPLVHYYYNIRWKGHFEETWESLFNIACTGFLERSEGAETVFVLPATYSPSYGLQVDRLGPQVFPANAQIDFQVEAMIGYIVDYGPFSERSPREDFCGEKSGWSNTQTFCVSKSLSLPTPTSLPTSQPYDPAPTGSVVLLPEQSGPNLFAEINVDSDLLFQAAVLAVVFIVVAALIVVMVRPR